MQIAPSMLASDFANLGGEVKRITAAGADLIHLDVMDGSFVPNITFGAPVIQAIRSYTETPFDVHLMISHPGKYIQDFIKAGADIISFHCEAEDDVAAVIKEIARGGAKPALAIKPGTPVEAVFPYLEQLAMVLVMTVEPGFGGQSFMANMMDKVRAIKERRPAVAVEVDGGINLDTVRVSARAGVDICVAGTSVFKAQNPAAMIAELKACAQER